jgi:hypothetical protein
MRMKDLISACNILFSVTKFGKGVFLMSKPEKTSKQRSDARKQACQHLTKLVAIIEETFDSADNPRVEFAMMFKDPEMLRKVTTIIYPVVWAGVNSQALVMGKIIVQRSVSNEQADAVFNNVKVHLTENGSWNTIEKKFPSNCIRNLVWILLERGVLSSYLPLYFEHLREHECMEDFIRGLELDYNIPRDFESWAYNDGLQEIEEKADYLNKVILSKYEHNRLRLLEKAMSKNFDVNKKKNLSKVRSSLTPEIKS